MTETKAQRECPYCQGHADLIHSEDMQTYIAFEEYVYLYTENDEGCQSREIHYCPVCGRKLEVRL
ncbi:hypothetical protein HC026_11020 [Lactobacillus sp. LC28-10]|uniref:Small CPxCG-related zinc finger protein n=1 Tax=Secundilactobacillus angelensis TaxID=2722706 RepID=A0ABX1KZQ9_9LACO|nr:hypothetical protein [Secundilactobacillus angelensis]MCH5463217.1 hypothetical protein [Secundilactobacillus angelensis]NLR19424.1 hypothetical protein [Secundilactobacillus angelensis]